MVDHDCLPGKFSNCCANLPTRAPVRNATRMASIARGRRAVREFAEETAVAVISPVHRPASLASEDGEMYEAEDSSKYLWSD